MTPCNPCGKQAVAGKRKVVFADAVHFVRGAFLGDLGCFLRWIVPTGAGRQRSRVLDAVSRALLCKTTDATVDRVTVGRLLPKIRDAHPHGPIRVVGDNARYQHAAIVRGIAADARIDVVYLPPYSPNLNPIERVWKVVKKEALANRTFADYPAFRAAIDASLDQLGTTHRDRLTTLLAYRFETLEPASDLAA